MLLGSALTGMRKKQTGMRNFCIGREVMGGIHRCGVTCLAEVFRASGCLWLNGVVDYADSISHAVSDKGLRPDM